MEATVSAPLRGFLSVGETRIGTWILKGYGEAACGMCTGG